MPLSREDIRKSLAEFASRWDTYLGSERAEAQPFLEELLECFGTDRRQAGIRFEDPSGAGFMDLHWPGVCIVEMKRPSEAKRLAVHKQQAFAYWERSGSETHRPARYVVLCSFTRFQIWEPGYDEPRAQFDLKELPDNLDALLFLAGQEPVFLTSTAELTREAAAKVTDMLRSLESREAADPDVLRDFALQCVWCMFAEDLQMLPGHLFTRLVDGLVRDSSRSSQDDLGLLFQYLNQPEDRPARGMYAAVPYVDGALFRIPARVDLNQDELALLREACESPWNRVEPAIFGSLLEGALGRERQWSLGAHYTAEADILKVVLPTIAEPWRDRIAACESVPAAEAAESDLLRYVVLDPACGSGNFLYVAYRELRRIEAELRSRTDQLRREAGLPEQRTLSFFPLTNMRGIEIEPFAVKLARVTLWMGHRLAVEELDLPERVLPLVDLSGIQRADALKVQWPPAHAIIGNPPFQGAANLRSVLGDDYAEWLKHRFGIGLKDLCVYWFRRAHESLPVEGRAGLVGTNSVSQNIGRDASLAYIVSHGGVITDAVSTQDWPGAAAVDVSIVNWIRAPTERPRRFRLDGSEVPGITSSLTSTAAADVAGASRLRRNASRSFEGVKPGGAGFILSGDEALDLRSRHPCYADVVRPYLVGDDIVSHPLQRPTRWIIDFGVMSLEEALEYPDALEIVRQRVKPVRDVNRRRIRRERWWLFSEPVPAMRQALSGLSRFLASNVQGKRLQFAWYEPEVCASNLTKVFALSDDFSIAVLMSRIHYEWARAQSSTLEDRFRYTPTTAFETFPWPQPSQEQREEAAGAARMVMARRQGICLERQIGLTKLYNEVDEGAYRDLAELHERLEEAVAAAYGWPSSAAHDSAESNRRLLELNRAIAAGEIEYRPFG